MTEKNKGSLKGKGILRKYQITSLYVNLCNFFCNIL